MSTYFKHFGNVTIREVVKKTSWKLVDKEEIIDVNRAIKLESFFITNGKYYVLVRVNNEGEIISFNRYGNNNADFLYDFIGYSVTEHDYREGIIDYYEDDELSEWLEENTFFDDI